MALTQEQLDEMKQTFHQAGVRPSNPDREAFMAGYNQYQASKGASTVVTPAPAPEEPGFLRGVAGDMLKPFQNIANTATAYGGAAVEKGLSELTGIGNDKSYADMVESNKQALEGAKYSPTSVVSGVEGNNGVVRDVTTMKGVEELGGDVLKSAATVAPGGGMKGMLASGAAYGAGNAMSEGKGVADIAKETGVGLVEGGLFGAGGKLVDATIVSPVKAILKQYKPGAIDAMMRGLKPGVSKPEFKDTIATVLPVITQYTEKTKTPITTVEQLANTVKDIKKQFWSDYSTALGGAENHMIDSKSIGDAIRNSIGERDMIHNPGLRSKIDNIADQYSGFMTPQKAEEFLQSANADLETYYSKNKTGQATAAKYPNIKYVLAEANAIRDALYRTIEQATGKDAAALKKMYGKLSEFQTVANKRAAVVGGQSPFSLAEQLSVPNNAVDAAGNLATGQFFSAAKNLGSMALTKALKEANTPDSLVETSLAAFAKAKTPKQFEKVFNSIAWASDKAKQAFIKSVMSQSTSPIVDLINQE